MKLHRIEDRTSEAPCPALWPQPFADAETFLLPLSSEYFCGGQHVERLIGSIRRECLDHVVVAGESYLPQILKTYATYYNEVRTHLSLAKDALDFRRSRAIGSVVAIPILVGLYHQYLRV